MILFAGNWVAIYFNNKSYAEEAVLQCMVIDNCLVYISPLVRQTTRLVFSNVYHGIPNHVLANLNIKDFIPLVMKENLSHVMSFRRQVHVFIEPSINIPDHMNISHGGGATKYTCLHISSNILTVRSVDMHVRNARNARNPKTLYPIMMTPTMKCQLVTTP